MILLLPGVSVETASQCGGKRICCQEVEAVEVEELQAEPRCIVQHPGFETVCLNVWVLQTAWLQYGSSAY